MQTVGRFKRQGILLTLAAALGDCAVVHAEPFQPQAIRLASGIDLTPEVLLSMQFDDNIANSALQAKSSWINLFQPAVTVQLPSQINNYTLQAKLNAAYYSSSQDDNYVDADVRSDNTVRLSERQQVVFLLRYRDGHEARGSGISEGRGDTLNVPVDVSLSDAQVEYRFGSEHSIGGVQLQLGYQRKDYDNYPELSQYRSLSSGSVGAGFDYHLADTFSLLAEINQVQSRYAKTDPLGSRDSDTQNYRFGFRWSLSQLTSAELKVGYQHRAFKQAERQNFDGVAWDMAVNWAPLSYSHWRLATGRQSKNPDTQGDYVQATDYRLAWQHYWQQFFSTTMSLSYVDDRYSGVERHDKRQLYSVKAAYSFSPSLFLEFGASWQRNQSNVAAVDYDKNQTFISLQMAL